MTQPDAVQNLPPVYGDFYVCVPAPVIHLDTPPTDLSVMQWQEGDVIRAEQVVLQQIAEHRLKRPSTQRDRPSVSGFPFLGLQKEIDSQVSSGF